MKPDTLQHLVIDPGAFGPEHTRAETGPLQFNDDWPGLFIRGDNALFFGLILSEFLANPANLPEIYKRNLQQLAALLRDVDVRWKASHDGAGADAVGVVRAGGPVGGPTRRP